MELLSNIQPDSNVVQEIDTAINVCEDSCTMMGDTIQESSILDSNMSITGDTIQETIQSTVAETKSLSEIYIIIIAIAVLGVIYCILRICKLRSELNKTKTMLNDINENNPKTGHEDVYDVIWRASFNVEKQQGKGEDSDPIAYPLTNGGVIAVFDGLGGGGRTKYKNNNNPEEIHTGAYLASRYVKGAFCRFLDNCKNIGDLPNNELAHCEIIEGGLKELDGAYTVLDELKGVKIKTLRKFPTTMAMCVYQNLGGKYEINCFWAGDSRIYMLDQNTIYFLTKDDTDSEDPFSPQYSDAPMSNVICCDREFHINKTTVSIEDYPCICIAATDGCFGYYINPIEFEMMLRKELSESVGYDDFKDRVLKEIEKVKQDDISMSIVVIAAKNTSFVEIKKKLSERLSDNIFTDFCQWKEQMTGKKAQIIKDIEDREQEVNLIKEQIIQVEKTLNEQNVQDSNYADFEELNQSKEKNDDEICALRQERQEIDEQIKSENIDWYLKYKKTVVFVNGKNTI